MLLTVEADEFTVLLTEEELDEPIMPPPAEEDELEEFAPAEDEESNEPVLLFVAEDAELKEPGLLLLPDEGGAEELLVFEGVLEEAEALSLPPPHPIIKNPAIMIIIWRTEKICLFISFPCA